MSFASCICSIHQEDTSRREGFTYEFVFPGRTKAQLWNLICSIISSSAVILREFDGECVKLPGVPKCKQRGEIRGDCRFLINRSYYYNCGVTPNPCTLTAPRDAHVTSRVQCVLGKRARAAQIRARDVSRCQALSKQCPSASLLSLQDLQSRYELVLYLSSNSPLLFHIQEDAALATSDLLRGARPWQPAHLATLHRFSYLL